MSDIQEREEYYKLDRENKTQEAISNLLTLKNEPQGLVTDSVRDYNVGSSNYSKHKIQPWDIWLEYSLNPWDADI